MQQAPDVHDINSNQLSVPSALHSSALAGLANARQPLKHDSSISIPNSTSQAFECRAAGASVGSLLLHQLQKHQGDR
jgi:hypothetical protein